MVRTTIKNTMRTKEKKVTLKKEYQKDMSDVQRILKIDSQFRHDNLKNLDDLHTLDRLVSGKVLDYDHPTLVNRDFDYNKSIKLLNSKEEFCTAFYEKYPFLCGVNMENMLIAGGSICDIVRSRSSSADVDFFIYGLSVQQANERIKVWINEILTNAKKYIDKKTSSQKKTPNYSYELNCEMIRNNNTLLINICGKSLQLIFRLYKSKSEILHGFDLGSSAIGFDGTQVYLTSLGKFCQENSCNIVDSTRRSTTYEYRLEKYFARDFNIVLPCLDISLLRKDYFRLNLPEACMLPHFTFSYSDIRGNKIIVEDFYNKFSQTSDYELADINEYNCFNLNMNNIVNDVDYFYYTSTDITVDNSCAHDILKKMPRLSKGSIISFYEILKKELNNRKIDISKIKRYLPCENPAVIAKNMIENSDSEYLDSLIDKQTRIVLDKLVKLQQRDHTQIRWITENPGSQLSGSFNPVFKDENEWYGEHYKSPHLTRLDHLITFEKIETKSTSTNNTKHDDTEIGTDTDTNSEE